MATTTRDRFLQALIVGLGGTPELLVQSGVTVRGDSTRAENHVSAGYSLASHFFVTCDPAVSTVLAEATASMEPTLTAWTAVAAELRGELLGGGPMHVLTSNVLPTIHLPAAYTVRSLDADNTTDFGLIEQFVSANTEHDLDEAEIELADLNPMIEVVLDPEGRVAAFASSIPFDLTPTFADIGVLTRPDSRGKHLGKTAVASLCKRLLHAGHDPLYRCEATNAASLALAASLGFQPATQLIAYRFPEN